MNLNLNSKIVIIDYGMGNINSIYRKISNLGVDTVVSSCPDDVILADKLILPGVGHFKKAVENLKKMKLWDILNKSVIINKTPILGICLGLQLMAEYSEEGDSEGFGWLNAIVVRFNMKNGSYYKIPHMGWNTVKNNKPSKLLEGIEENSEFYFIHSYHIKSFDESQVLNYTEYEYVFPSAMEYQNIYGVQYHPEKSHEIGVKLLSNFIKV